MKKQHCLVISDLPAVLLYQCSLSLLLSVCVLLWIRIFIGKGSCSNKILMEITDVIKKKKKTQINTKELIMKMLEMLKMHRISFWYLRLRWHGATTFDLVSSHLRKNIKVDELLLYRDPRCENARK